MPRRHVWTCLLLLLPVASWAQAAAPSAPAPPSPAVQAARQALSEARQLLEPSTRLPREELLQVGLLQALLGDLDGGLAVLAAAPSAAGPTGPRWHAVVEVAQVTSLASGPEAVQRAAERRQGEDRAALLHGLVLAQFELGQWREALLNAQELGGGFPAVAATLLVARAEALQASGSEPPTELLSRALDLARKVPPGERSAAQVGVQADLLGRLALLYAALANDDAALAAVGAIEDPDDRQQPFLRLAARLGELGRFAAAAGAATKLSLERPDPATGASLQAAAFARLATQQQRQNQPDGAQQAAARTVEAARRTVDNYIRVRSLLLAAETLVATDQRGQASAVIAQALSELHVTTQSQRANALFAAARAHALAGQREVAEGTFKAAREVAALSREPSAWDAAVTVPASVGWVGEAAAGLALRRDPVALRDGRLLLVEALATGGYQSDAVAAAREFKADAATERQPRLQALCRVARTAGPGAAELLREALALTAEPPADGGVREVAVAAAELGLPVVALEAYGQAVAGAAKAPRPESAAAVDALLPLVQQALHVAAAAKAPLAEVAQAAQTAAAGSPEPMAQAAALTVVGGTLAALGEPAGAEQLLAAAAGVARAVKPATRQIRALAEIGAALHAGGFRDQAAAAFDQAEVLTNALDTVPPAVLLGLAECEAEAGRQTTSAYLLRSLLTIRDFEREGSTDLRLLARCAGFVGLTADSLAMARRVYRPEERLAAWLDLARLVAGRPVAPLRARDTFPLPAGIAAAEERHGAIFLPSR